MFMHIEFGTRHPEKKDMVFCAIYCADSISSIKFNQVDPKDRGRHVPLVLMLLRWDGRIGFPGGKVNEGENLMSALIREIEEEIHLNLSDLKDNIQPLCSFKNNTDSMHIHCFEYQINEPLMRQIIQHSSYSKHFLSEVQGTFAMQIVEFKQGKGINEFKKNNFAATAGMELDVLIKKKGWL